MTNSLWITRRLWVSLAVLGVGLALSGCTPSDVAYCRAHGVEGTAEYGKCIRYYNQQEALFSADRGLCEMRADGTYPPTLYDRGHYARTFGGFGPHGEYYGSRVVHVGPDWHHNRQVDALRMRIIAPCMQEHGWNSANDWQAGRRPVTQKKSGVKQKLPWQK